MIVAVGWVVGDCCNIFFSFFQGKGVSVDYEEALRLFLLASNLGCAAAFADVVCQHTSTHTPQPTHIFTHFFFSFSFFFFCRG